MHMETGSENLDKLRAQLNIFNVTIQVDPQISWKLLNAELLDARDAAASFLYFDINEFAICTTL